MVDFSKQSAGTSAGGGIEIERFRLLLDVAPNGIIVVDNKGLIVLINANAENMFAYEKGELVGQSMRALLPERYRNHHGGHISSFFGGPAVRPMGDGRQLSAARKDGSEFPVEIGLQPVKTDKGEDMALAVVVDISQRQRLQEERQQMDARVLEINENEQRRLGREIHDDLCQQLAAIGCLAKVIEQKLKHSDSATAEGVGELVSLISQANSRAREISRGSAAAMLDVNGLPGALKELSSLTCKGNGAACALECQEGESSGSASVDLQLYRIAQEAVNNAVRHGQAEKISITLSRKGNELVLSVKDDGSGISEESLQQMTGMGLRTMSYRAQASGGQLKINHREVSGTEVYCVVPIR